jgi:diacylglycerol O-acyltransferase
MNEADACMWVIERDPALRTTIVAVSFLDRTPDWAHLRRRVAAAIEQIPRLRQRVATNPAGVGTPHWVDDDGVDLDFHLRRVAAPFPGGDRAVLDMAGVAAMAAFDKDRPLWEFTLVEGLEGGSAALIQKLHHCVTDGVGAVALARVLFDDHPVLEPEQRLAAGSAPVAVESGGRLLAKDAAGEVGRAARLGVRLAATAPAAMLAAAADPVAAARGTWATAASVGRLVAPVRRPGSPLWADRGMSRRLDVVDVPLGSLHDAGHAAGGTLNDAFLAGIAGAALRYHRRAGARLERLRVTMPVSVRRAGDALGNNRFVPVRFSLPVADEDPSARIARIAARAHASRAEPALPLTDLVTGALNRLPAPATTAVLGAMLKSIDVVATNIAGFDHPTYLAGARVTRTYGFAPPSGAALSVALLSQLDRCGLGLTVDTTAVTDPAAFTADVLASFDEILALGAATPPNGRTPHPSRPRGGHRS